MPTDAMFRAGYQPYVGYNPYYSPTTDPAIQSNIQRLQASNAERQRQLDIEGARGFQREQTATEFGNTRQLAQDRFGYESALLGQRQDFEAGQQDVRFMHEDELFEMTRNAAIAEKELANIQALKMAEFNAFEREQQDYRIHGFSQENTANAQNFTREMTKDSQRFQMGRDDAQQSQAQEMALLGHSLGVDTLNRTQSFTAQEAEKRDAADMTKAVVSHRMAMQGQIGFAEKQRRYEEGKLTEKGNAEYEQELLSTHFKGLNANTHRFMSPEVQYAWEKTLPNELMAIENDTRTNRQQKAEAKAQVYEKMKRLLITGVKAIPEYERAASEENRRQQFINTLPKQEDKEIPWQPDGKGGYQVPRGYKDEKPPMQLSPEELERHFSTNTKTLSDGTVIQFEQTPNGGKWTKVYSPVAANENKDDSFNKNKARTTYINNQVEKRITRIAKSYMASNPKSEPEDVERYKREVRGAVEEAVKLEVASWDAAGTQSPQQTPQAPQGQQSGEGQLPTQQQGEQQPFDTPLNPVQEQQYQNWAKQNNRPSDETNSYDMRGAWKDGIKGDGRGHFPDTYKKPNHITFSTDSKYSNEQTTGGVWKEDSDKKWSYTPSAYVLQQHPARELKDYFDKYEPDSKLILPHAKSREEVMALKARGFTEFLGDDGQIHRIP